MRNLLPKYKYQLILIAAGIAWIALLNELLQIRAQGIIYPDSDNYREAAGFLYHDFKAHYYRPFGMALIFGLPYLFGATDTAIYDFSLIINIASWLGSALLVFSFLKRHLSANRSLAFALLFYTLVGSVCINFHLLTESIYTFLALLSFYFIERYYSKQSFHYLPLALGILLFTILVKPGAKFLAIVLIIYFGRTLLKNYKRRSMAFIYLGLGLIVFHCIKMRDQYGNFTISYIDSVTYYNYLGSKAMAFKNDIPPDQAIKERSDYIFSLSYPEMRDVGSKDMMAQVQNNTTNLLKAYFSDILFNTRASSDCIAICRNLEGNGYFEVVKVNMTRLSKYQNLLLTVIGSSLGLYFCIRSYRRPDAYTFIALYILYTIAISGVSYYQGDRFHLVFYPFVIILMGKFYAEKFHKSTLRSK